MRRAAPRGRRGLGHRAVERALAAADLVLTVNPRDVAGVKARLRPGAHQAWLPPFIDTRPFAPMPRAINDPPLLLSVGMMRTRDKLESYRVLADALGRLKDKPWRALLVGDGPARGEVEAMMDTVAARRVRFAGAVAHADLPRDICVGRSLPVARDQRSLTAWPSSKPRRRACPSSPAAPAACPRWWPTASPAC